MILKVALSLMLKDANNLAERTVWNLKNIKGIEATNQYSPCGKGKRYRAREAIAGQD